MSGSAKAAAADEKKKPANFNPIEAHRLLAELIRHQTAGLASHLQPKARAYTDYVLTASEEKSDG